MGRDFALIGASEADVALDAEATALADRIGLERLALEGLEIVEGEVDRVFDHARGVLLRPDRYVFGVVDEATDASDLVRLLATKLSLRN